MTSRHYYHIVSCHVLWRELCYFAALSPNVFTIEFLKQGLHNTPEVLRDELQKAVNRADGLDCEAVLIGYGLCSNGLQGITASKKPLVVMRGHDCITFLLGSKERYREYFDAHPGTYWYSPGWIDVSVMPGKQRRDLVYKEYVAKYGEDNAEYLMQMEQNWMKEYSNAAYVDLGFGDNTAHKAYTKQCAEWLGWNYDELTGNPRLVQHFLNGPWDSSDFLVVEPGARVEASNDEMIVRQVCC